jgi:ADP-dependent NAD(P)H-hydrate dehydratase
MESPTLEHVLEQPRLPARAADAHKGDYGRVLVIAGSKGLAGAAILAGGGALRGGAGLVTVATPAEVMDVVAAGNPCYMTAALPQSAAELPPADVVAAGPGLRYAGDIGPILRDLIKRFPGPMVLDADALKAVGRGHFARPNAPPAVLTPHPGEFARLLGKTVKEVQADREPLAAEFAQTAGVVLLLKGARTIVTDGRRAYTNTTGNPGMATGGCGDLMTGLIAALLGQHLPPFEAAALGAWAQGRAGDLAARHFGEVSMTAADVLAYLPAAMKECSDRS